MTGPQERIDAAHRALASLPIDPDSCATLETTVAEVARSWCAIAASEARAGGEIRRARAERDRLAAAIADAIRDYPGPDPSPASAAWWAGYREALRDAERIARTRWRPVTILIGQAPTGETS